MWIPFIYDASDRSLFKEPGYSLELDGSASRSNSTYDDTVYLDRKSFCEQSFFSKFDPPQGCTASEASLSNFTIGASHVCDPSENNWPANWKDSLLIFNSSYRDQSTLQWPSCMNSQGCGAILDHSRTDCTNSKPLCKLDNVGNCGSATWATNISCFCNSGE
jgi:hypothetical protein